MSSWFEAEARATQQAFRVQTFAAGVWLNGKEEYFAGGRVSPKTPRADTDTIFPIASVSKAFIATAVLMLAEEGVVDISSPMTRYLPDFAMYTDEMTRNLTVRDAMCHCCGLPRHDITLYTRENLNLEQFVGIVRYLPPAWPMYERFGYSNHMFAAISLLVVKVAGMPWGDFVEKRIFEPLGMRRSYTGSFSYCGADDNYARARILRNGANRPVAPINIDYCGSSGSISTGIRDLLQWVKLNLRGGILPGGDRLYSEHASSLLFGKQTRIKQGERYPYELNEITDSYYGFGWGVDRFRGERLIQHAGAIDGYRSFAGFMPDKDFAFAIFANSSESYACEALGRKLCDICLGYEGEDWNARHLEIASTLEESSRNRYVQMTEPPAVPPDIRGLAGRYENKAYGVFAVKANSSGLTVRIEGVERIKPMPLLPSKHFEWVIDLPLDWMALPCRFEIQGGRADRMLVHTDDDLREPMVFERLPSSASPDS